MSEEPSSKDPKKTTPKTWDSPKDARQNSGAGKYPNYYSHKTRSGHVFMMDDSNGSEHVTLQHRSGSMIQLMPDGAVQYVSHNGQYNIVFGENRILVTGAQDVVIQGDASLKVEGNYNINVTGDTNFNVNGNLNMSAKNLNQTIRGNIDILAKNKTEKTEGSLTQQSIGASAYLAEAGMTVAASDGLALVGGTQVAVASNKGELMLKAGAKMSLLGRSIVAIDGTETYIQSGKSDDAMSVFKQTAAKTPKKEA